MHDLSKCHIKPQVASVELVMLSNKFHVKVCWTKGRILDLTCLCKTVFDSLRTLGVLNLKSGSCYGLFFTVDFRLRSYNLHLLQSHHWF